MNGGNEYEIYTTVWIKRWRDFSSKSYQYKRFDYYKKGTLLDDRIVGRLRKCGIKSIHIKDIEMSVYLKDTIKPELRQQSNSTTKKVLRNWK